MNDNQILENFLDIAPFACILIGDSLEIKYMNPVMSEFFSTNLDQDMTGSEFLKFLPEEGQESFLDFINSLGEAQPTQNWRLFKIIDGSGKGKSILLNGIHNNYVLEKNGGVYLVGMPIIENHFEHLLTDNLAGKIRNRFARSKYDSVIESATIGITIFDKDGVIEDTNQTFAEQIGLSKEAIIGKHFSDFLDKDSVKIIERMLKNISEKENNLTKDTLTIAKPDNSHIILQISIARIKDVEANPGKLMLISEDITHQEDTYTALLQSEKLALTGRLAASLAHEINNPLQTSIGCLGLVEEMLDDDDDEDLRVYIEMATEELQRSARIVKKLRDLNRKTDISEKEPVNLQEIIEGVLILTKNRLYDHNVVPIFPYQGPPPYVLASRDQIQQVVLNMVMNAIDSQPNGGNLYLDLFETQNPKGYQIKIRDTGKGIPPEVMDNLFEPFFTTKQEGLGLGLYICKQIIENHNGSIRVESEPNKGTSFTIWLPGSDDTRLKE